MRSMMCGALMATLLLAAPLRADEADDQFAVAAGHYARQRWKLAVDEFQVFLQKHPAHPKAKQGTFLLGESLLQTGHNEEARKHFREYLDRDPAGEYAPKAMFRAGDAAYRAGKFDVAKPDLVQFLAKYPGDGLNAYVLPYLGDIALRQADTAAAEKCFRDGLQRFPQGPLQDDCRMGLARVLELFDKKEEAEKLYLAVAGKSSSPLAPEAQFRTGTVQYALGKHAQAIETFAVFETKLAGSPWKPYARMGRGWALWKLNRTEEAKPFFQSVVADPKLGVQARYWLGLTEKAQEHWAAAIQTLLAAAAAADPKHELTPAIHFHAGDALLKSGDAAGAAKQFDQVIALAPGGNEWIEYACRGKIQVALQTKDYQSADRQAADFHARFPSSPLKADVQRLQATALLERKQYEPAVELLEPLLAAGAKKERLLETRYLLAVGYEGLKRYDDALTVLAPVLQSAAPRLKADALLRQGSLLVAKQRYADALAPLEAFFATKPTGDSAVKAWGELTICYSRTGKLDKAKQFYAELLDKYPKHHLIAPTTEQLAEAAYDAGDTAWARQLFSRLRGASGSTGDVPGGPADNELKGLSGLAWSQYKGGQLAEAAATFDQVLGKNPPAAMAAEAALARGRILEQLNQADPALVMYDLVIEKYSGTPQHVEALLASARLRDKLQQGKQAAPLYERLAKQYPEFPKLDAVLYEWAWVLQELGKADEAAELFQRLRKEFPQSRFAPDAAYRLAYRAYAAKDYAKAKELLAELLAGKPEARIREYARYLAGQVAVSEQKWQEAREAFETFLKEFPDGPRRAVAEFWIAEAVYRQGDHEAAGQRFDQLARQLAGRRESWMAMIPLRRAQVLAQQKKWTEAYAIASKIEKEYPNFDQQYEADYLIGRCLHTQAELQAAREAFQKVVNSPAGEKTETAAMAQWMIGETYFHQKNYETALREYLRLEILYAYPTWQAAAVLQAGKCRELLGEPKEAAELYAHLIKEYPNTPFAEQAARRLRTPPGQPATNR